MCNYIIIKLRIKPTANSINNTKGLDEIMTQETINELLTIFDNIRQEDEERNDGSLRIKINTLALDEVSAAIKEFDEAINKLNCAVVDSRTIGEIEDTAMSMLYAGEEQGFIKGFIYARGLLGG